MPWATFWAPIFLGARWAPIWAPKSGRPNKHFPKSTKNLKNRGGDDIYDICVS